MAQTFHEKLKKKIDDYVSYCYRVAKKFPRDEIYITVSQLKRAVISIMLNYVEGYGRKRPKVKLNFYEISYGSTQECKYIIYLAQKERWITHDEYIEGLNMVEEIGKMLWSTIQGIEDRES